MRNLEAGSSDRPRRSTLDQVARGLRLNVERREEFLAAWDIVDSLTRTSISEILAGAAGVDQVIETMARRGTHVTLLERCAVGPDRLRRWFEVTDAYQALVDGVDRVLMILGPNPYLYLDRLTVSELDGCRIDGQRIIGDPSVAAFDIGFGRTLRRGETHIFGYRINYAHAWRPTVHDADADTRAEWTAQHLRGLRRSAAALTIQIQFDPAALPRGVRQVYRTSGDGLQRDIAELRLDAAGCANVAIVDPQPGVHGVVWDWD